MCRFVLTYEMCGGDILGCIGVYDDPEKCLGAILAHVLDEMDHCEPYESGSVDTFTMKWYHDSSNDNFYQLEVKYSGQPEEEPADIYRVYYLREADE